MNVISIDPKSIIIPEDRQRRGFPDIDSIAESMGRLGQISPIIIDDYNNLVAGGRRLKAALQLGLPSIFAVRWNDLSTIDRIRIELEENIKRKDLTWQEEVGAIRRYHEICEMTSSEWTARQTAKSIGMSEEHISEALMVSRACEKVPGLLVEASMRTVANILRRQQQRQIDSEMEKFFATEAGAKPEKSVVTVGAPYSLVNAAGEDPKEAMVAGTAEVASFFRKGFITQGDFIEYAANFSGVPFNFIHCDFPYGLNMGTANLQGTRSDLDRYDDTDEIYWKLLFTLTNHRDELIARSAHIMFWLPMEKYSETAAHFRAFDDFTVNPYPLVWHKEDGKGIIPDPERGGRRTYETALLVSRGDRRIIRAKAMSVSQPTNKASAAHLSEKPIPVLRHFFEMLVDDSTRLLDPTCGCGNAVIVAEEMRTEYALGLEIDQKCADDAKARLIASRNRSDFISAISPE